MSEMRIAILGAGIMGLSTAQTIKDNLPNASITVFAEDFSPHTTSDFSSGYWHPFCFSTKDSSEENMLKWSHITYDKFFELCTSSKASECGAQLITSYVLSTNPTIPDPVWSDCVIQYQKLNETELQLLGFTNKARSGFSFLTSTIEMKKYLPFLQKNLQTSGVHFKRVKITSLSQLMEEASSNFDYVINCTEKGAKQLFNDKNVDCVRGHVMILDAPWVKFGVTFDDHPRGSTYILPLTHGVMVGGTAQKNEPSAKSDEDEYNNTFERAASIVRSLTNAKVVDKNVGFWAYRTGGTRVELESVKCGKEDVKIIHNYGQGGSGITLSWGCANEVLEIIKTEMSKQSGLAAYLF